MGPMNVHSVADRDDNLARIRELTGLGEPSAVPFVVENRAERRRRVRQRRRRRSAR